MPRGVGDRAAVGQCEGVVRAVDDHVVGAGEPLEDQRADRGEQRAAVAAPDVEHGQEIARTSAGPNRQASSAGTSVSKNVTASRVICADAPAT